MKRLYLTVEGQTEAAFALNVLAPHLANFSVYIAGVRFTGPTRRTYIKTLLTTTLHPINAPADFLRQN